MSEWEAGEGEHWAANAEHYTRMLGTFGDELLDAAALRPGELVLDIGCGCGDVSLAAAKAVTGTGTVLGVDLSPAMLGVARHRAEEAGLTQATFVQGDASRFRTDDAMDAALSRFGVMFFDDPVAAFANIRASLRPGGRLVFVCWRTLFDNEWMMVPGAVVAEVLPLPAGGEPNAPGPFALADIDRTTGLLSDAGFRDPAGVSVAGNVWLGRDATEAAAFLRTSGLGRAVFEGADPALVEKAVGRVTEVLADHQLAGGVELGGAAWVVTATA
jgi:SAM-dependent methyltransferase